MISSRSSSGRNAWREQIWVSVSRSFFFGRATSRGGGDRSGCHGGVFVGMDDELFFRWMHLSIKIIFLVDLLEVYCLQPGWEAVDSRQCIVKDSLWMVRIHNFFCLVVLKCLFMFSQISESEKLLCFSSVNRTRRGLVELKYFSGLGK